MLKSLITFLAEPFTYLVNNYLATAVAPRGSHLSNIQEGDPEDITNCSPVSLIEVVCKTFERILKMTILSFLSECNAKQAINMVFTPAVVPF